MRCVLIVDDEPMIRKGLSIMIQQCSEHPYNIKLAQNGEEAIQLIMEEQPDFLLQISVCPK